VEGIGADQRPGLEQGMAGKVAVGAQRKGPEYLNKKMRKCEKGKKKKNEEGVGVKEIYCREKGGGGRLFFPRGGWPCVGRNGVKAEGEKGKKGSGEPSISPTESLSKTN